ncbi:hypothetical protein, partial [Flavobacterium anhuiense]|uniref:hypothetical protein n=1 Tax=Flavobacterium anhuiense TaxID=459526 RepID=UPI0034D95998
SNLSMSFRVLRGANVKSFFFSRKLFSIFFFRKSLFQNMIKLPECLRAFFAIAGAKVEPFSSYPSFFPNYFHSFSAIFLNCLITAGLHFIFFSHLCKVFLRSAILWAVLPQRREGAKALFPPFLLFNALF